MKLGLLFLVVILGLLWLKKEPHPRPFSEMTPSIDAAKKLAKILDTSVGYLLGENEQANLFKDPAMLKRFQDISVLPEKEKECLLTTVDHFIKASKISLM